MELSQYRDLFVSEGQDHLQEMNQALLHLEKQPDDLAHLETFFRAAHTLKGMSAAMGFQPVAALAHEMENTLDVLRHRERRLSSGLADALFRCLDTLSTMIDQVAAGEAPTAPEGAGGIQELLSAGQEPTPSPQPPAVSSPTETGWEVQVQVAESSVLKGPRAFLILKRLGAVAPILETNPPELELRGGQYERSFRLVVAPQADAEALQRAAEGVAEVEGVVVRRLGPESASRRIGDEATERAAAAAKPKKAAKPAKRRKSKGADQRIGGSAVERLEEGAGQGKGEPAIERLSDRAIERLGEEARQRKSRPARQRIKEAGRGPDKGAESDAAATSAGEAALVAVAPTTSAGEAAPVAVAPTTSAGEAAPVAVAITTSAGEAAPVAPLVRVKVSLLDQLVEAMADLVMNRSLVAQIARKHELPGMQEAVESYGDILARLQQAVLAMRMTPVIQVFNRFPRMMRDLARQEGKEVRFDMEGTELELDRAVLDKITDPLVHLLRNAVDHGVEAPEARRQAGKELPATVRLRAQRAQDKAIIEVIDDGQGMDPDKILQLAVARGLVNAEQAAELDRMAILELICRPGFSTKTEVSGVSGRGVGMEVVKEAMDEIGGALEIETEIGQGSCFRLSFPLTMAILPVLLIRSGGEVYAVPLAHIVRTVEAQQDQVRYLHQQPVLSWEERLLPLLPLDALLGIAEGQSASNGESRPVIIVERGRQRYGLVVDEILGKEEIVLKPLGVLLQEIEGLAGATVRGEGEVVLVLDVPGLLKQVGRGEAPPVI